MTRLLVREPGRAADVAEILKALGHSLRLRIVALLADGGEHVNALADRLDVPSAIVSQQLRILRMSGLVSVERAGGQAMYRIADARIYRLLDCMEHQP
jgi:DNA-binding transcriptional ArsR family regulator